MKTCADTACRPGLKRGALSNVSRQPPTFVEAKFFRRLPLPAVVRAERVRVRGRGSRHSADSFLPVCDDRHEPSGANLRPVPERVRVPCGKGRSRFPASTQIKGRKSIVVSR